MCTKCGSIRTVCVEKKAANTSSILKLIVCPFPFRFQRHYVFSVYRSILPFYRFTVCLRVPASATEREERAGVSRGPYCKCHATILTTGRGPPPIPVRVRLFAAERYGQQASACRYGCGSTTRVHPPSRALASECTCQRECQ